jgi:hypothetical protein
MREAEVNAFAKDARVVKVSNFVVGVLHLLDHRHSPSSFNGRFASIDTYNRAAKPLREETPEPSGTAAKI